MTAFKPVVIPSVAEGYALRRIQGPKPPTTFGEDPEYFLCANFLDRSSVRNNLEEKMKKLFSLVLLSALLFVGACKSKDGANPFDPTTLVPTATVTTVPVQCLINYPVTQAGGYDLSGRAVSITSYPGSSLSSVVLDLYASTTGFYDVTLYAIDGCSASGVTLATSTRIDLSLTGTHQPVTFTFSGNPSIVKNSILALVPKYNVSPGTAKAVPSYVSNAVFACYYANFGGVDPIVKFMASASSCASVMSNNGLGIQVYGKP
jgi:hypothetical protein